MEANFVIEALGHAAKIIKPGASWSEESIRNILIEVAPYRDEAMKLAVKRMSVEFSPGILPPLRKVADIIVAEGMKYNQAQGIKIETDWQKDKKQASEDLSSSLQPKESDSLRNRSIKLINRMLNGDFTKIQAVEAMEWMDLQYPHIGWKQEAASLAAHYSRHERDDNQQQSAI